MPSGNPCGDLAVKLISLRDSRRGTSRLRGFEASRLCDLQIFGKKVKLDFNVFMQLWGHFGGTLGSLLVYEGDFGTLWGQFGSALESLWTARADFGPP